MKVLDLFSGIGGFSLGLERVGMRTVAFCECNEFAAAVLRKHWPNITIYPDIRDLDAAALRCDGIGAIDVVCGGFPCQDISAAGARAGIDGEQSGLWREMARIIGDVRPRFAIVENSAALAWNGLGRILSDLAAVGYDAEWHCIRASAIGCAFEGDRLYLVATTNVPHGPERMGLRAPILDAWAIQQAYIKCRARVWLETTSRFARMGHGFSDRLDRRRRTEVLGNAVVPQVIEMIGAAIMRREREA